MPRRILRHDQRGVTLVELIVVMALALLLAGSAYMAYAVQVKTGDEQGEVAAMQQDLRVVMDLLGQDIRMAGYSPYQDLGAGIVAADSGSERLRVTMDLDRDTRVLTVANPGLAGAGEDISYLLDDDENLFRIDRNDASVKMNAPDTYADYLLARNVEKLAFTYRVEGADVVVPAGKNLDDISVVFPAVSDGGVSRTATVDDITAIGVTLNVRSEDPVGGAGAQKKYMTRTLSKTVCCRNLGE